MASLVMIMRDNIVALYQVQLADKTDLACLQEIEQAADMLFPVGRLPTPADTMPIAALESARDNGLLWVATLAGAIVGFAMSQESAGFLHLAVIAVHPDHGRRGIGTQLVKAVIQQARGRKLSGVTLTTFQDLPWNAPFYRRLGFQILPSSELSPRLRDILAQEANLGMKNRVAMLYSNDA